MGVEPTAYEPLGSHDLMTCTICGALVHFTFMVLHTAWHKEAEDEATGNESASSTHTGEPENGP